MRNPQTDGGVTESLARSKAGTAKKPRFREEDSHSEDSGEKVPGQKKARRLHKEQIELEVENTVTLAAIAAQVAKFN